MNNKSLKLFALLIIYFFIILFFVLNFNLGYTISMILYLLIPSVYFSWQNQKIIKKILFYAFSFSMPAVFIFDYIAHVSNSWYVPSEIGIRVLGAFPLEEIVWSFLFFYYILIIYTTFFIKHQNTKIFSSNTKYLAWLFGILASVFTLVFIFNKDLLIIDNFYILLIVFVMIIPSIIFLYNNPQYIKRVILITLVFLPTTLIYEYSALKTGQWFFNGQHYIGWVHFLDVKFPIEELLFMIFSASGTISFYEFSSKEKSK